MEGVVSLNISGLPLQLQNVQTGYYMDANLSLPEWQPLVGCLSGVPSAFGVVLLPTRNAPALITAPSLQPPVTSGATPAWAGLPIGDIPRPIFWNLVGVK